MNDWGGIGTVGRYDRPETMQMASHRLLAAMRGDTSAEPIDDKPKLACGHAEDCLGEVNGKSVCMRCVYNEKRREIKASIRAASDLEKHLRVSGVIK